MNQSEKNRKKASAARTAKAPGPHPAGRSGLYVVGIGASAGGLEAFEQFFSHLPADTGMAFVLVQHLEPTHKGMIPELLSRHTKMPVVQVEDGMQVQPNCVYVIPPNADLAILHGQLHVLEPASPRGLWTPIDSFFQHLAEDQKEKAIGIILSGMGSDGTRGIRVIKEHLGAVLVQDPTSAKYDGMPRSAIATGMADYIASAQELPAKLIQYVTHLPVLTQAHPTIEDEPASDLGKIFILLRAHRGNDFSCYKKSTIVRRIERRMSIHQFNSLSRYVRFLQENPQEIELLHKELLIGVTNFFREPEMYAYLQDHALPELFANRPPGQPLRVWNPACSTGEETYSLVIAIRECLEGRQLPAPPAFRSLPQTLTRRLLTRPAGAGFLPASRPTCLSNGDSDSSFRLPRVTRSRRKFVTW